MPALLTDRTEKIMKTTKSIGLLLLILTGTLHSACGEDLSTNINPALLYYRSFLLSPKGSQWDKDSDYLYTNNWQVPHLTERFGSIVSNYDSTLTLVRQAASQKVPCDWGIDLNLRGPETLLPHLADAKRAASAARYQAMWDLQNGNQAEARDDLLAALALGRNVSKDGTVISALVQIAIESIVCGTIAENFHRFSPETLQQLADGFDAAPPRGTIAASISGEKAIREWALSRIEDAQKKYLEDNAKALHAVRPILQNPILQSPVSQSGYEDWEQLTNAGGGTIDGMNKLLRSTEPLYAKLATIMALPYSEYEGRFKYESQPQNLQDKFQASANPFILQDLPVMQSCRRREFAIEVDLAIVRAAIEYKLHGEAGLKSVTDPCGNGPFTLRRFAFDGIDRGFELQSPFTRGKGPETCIFVETDGPPFIVLGTKPGQPVAQWPVTR